MTLYPHPVICERITEVWRRSGLTAEQFAHKIGAHDRKTIYRIRDGLSEPRATMVRKICVEFKVSPEWLLGLRRKE